MRPYNLRLNRGFAMKIYKVIAIVDRLHAQYAGFWRFVPDSGQDLPSAYSVRIRYNKRNIDQVKLWLRTTKQAFFQDEYLRMKERREQVTRKGIQQLREFRKRKIWLKRLRELEFIGF